MDPGLALLLAVPGAVDGPCYQHPTRLPDLCPAFPALPSAPQQLGNFVLECLAKVRGKCVA